MVLQSNSIKTTNIQLHSPSHDEVMDLGKVAHSVYKEVFYDTEPNCVLVIG